MEKNYYEILGVSQEMSCAEIVNELVDSFENMTDEEKEAYVVLTNLEARNAYDDELILEKAAEYDLGSVINQNEIDALLSALSTGELDVDMTEEEIEAEKAQLEDAIEEKTSEMVEDEEIDVDELGKAIEEKTQEMLDETEEEKAELSVVENEKSELTLVTNDIMGSEPEVEKPFWTKGRIALCTIAGVMVLGSVAIAVKAANSCGKNAVTNPTETESNDVPGTSQDTETQEPTETPETETPEVEEPTVINPAEVTEINSDNIDIMANYFMEKAMAKGLEVKAEDVRAALLIANMDSISKEELAEMVPGLDMIAEYNKANNYISAVNTHNIINAIYGQNIAMYISVADLSYNTNDKMILSHLDAHAQVIIEATNLGVLSQEQYNESFNYITRFYEQKDDIVLGDLYTFGYDDLSTGGKYLAEVGAWPNFSVAYTLSEHATQEHLNCIKSMELVTIDGARYLNEISMCGQTKTR